MANYKSCCQVYIQCTGAVKTVLFVAVQFHCWKNLLKQQLTNKRKSKVVLFFYHVSAMQFVRLQHCGHRFRLIHDLFWPKIF